MTTTPQQLYERGLQAAGELRFPDALGHYRRAAEAGLREAQHTCAVMLLLGERLYGPGVVADRTEAVRWLRKAAQQGCQVSQQLLRSVDP